MKAIKLPMKTRKRILVCASGMALMLAVVALPWACYAPLDLPSEVAGPRLPPVVPLDVEPLPSLRDFAAVWDKRLQRPLVDVAATEPAKATTPAPPAVPRPRLRLLGIYDGKYAVFGQMDSPTVEQTVAVGDRIAGGEVMRVDAQGAEIQVRGTSFTFRLDGRQ